MNEDNQMTDYYDHENSILLQKEKSEFFLKNIHSSYRDMDNNKLKHSIHINNLIFNKLRSKIFPDKNLETYSKHIYEATLFSDEPMVFSFILSSSTAIKELPEIFHFIDTLNTFKTKPILHFIFVEWPNLQAIEKQNSIDVQKDMSIFFNSTLSFLKKYLENPHIKKIPYEHIILHMEDTGNLKKDENFITDLTWIENFYDRENSYRHVSPKQASFDLVARRLVTKVTEESIFHNNSSQEKNYIVTTELNKRFLKCYRSHGTILNIAVRSYDG